MNKPQLPPELAAAWQNLDYGINHITGMTDVNQPQPECIIMLLAPQADLRTFRGCKVRYGMEYYQLEAGPIIRLKITFFDQPDHPFETEAFFNPGNPVDIEALGFLENQQRLLIYFWKTRSLKYAYTKVLNWDGKVQRIREIIGRSMADVASQPIYDFMKAKAEFVRKFPV